jgi:hypothetical protein
VDDLHHGARQLVVQDALVSSDAWSVIKVVVHAHDDVEGIAAFDRCGHDDLLHALVEIRGELLRGAKFAAAIEHDVHAMRGPVHVAQFGVFGEGDRAVADPERIAAVRHGLLRPAALHGVEGQQMRGALGATLGIIDQGPIEFGPVPSGAVSETANTTKSIDGDAGFVHDVL